MENREPGTSGRFTKWAACWGNATSITDRTPATYAKDITLRYPVRVCFDGCALRLHFSNLTGTEPVTLNEVTIEKNGSFTPVHFGGSGSITIEPGHEVMSDAEAMEITAGDTVRISVYCRDFTQMNAGTLITGPLSGGKYSYGNFACEAELPADLTRNTNWVFFLNTVDVLTEEKNHALICYGDSITAQSWPDYLADLVWNAGIRDLAVIRRAVSGTRILRQYSCITYAAYGLKGAVRFPVEMNTAGADIVLIQHGINDIIHPVGVEKNRFRPWSDMPTAQDLENGVTDIYIKKAKELGLRVWGGTLLPIFGWRTYAPFRDEIRNEFNDWIRSCPDFEAVVDFDAAVRDPEKPEAFREGFDSGDHLHPSEAAYKAMAEAALECIRRTL